VIDDPRGLEELLRGTLLGGRGVATVVLEGSRERIFAVDLQRDALRAEWSVARGLLAETGRWPLAAEGHPTKATANPAFIGRDGITRTPPTSPEEIDGAAHRALASLRTPRAQRGPPGPLSDLAAWQLGYTEQRCGAAPRLADLADALGAEPDVISLERWLLEWEEQRRPTSEPEYAGHLGWFPLHKGMLMFFPTERGPQTLAYYEFYAEHGLVGATAQGLISILEHWCSRYGAELVANWGTMLQFIVQRPPETLEQAWELALEQQLVAPDTTNGPGVPLRAHARTLLRRPTWFLHCRP
jgi:hypothetical protein